MQRRSGRSAARAVAARTSRNSQRRRGVKSGVLGRSGLARRRTRTVNRVPAIGVLRDVVRFSGTGPMTNRIETIMRVALAGAAVASLAGFLAGCVEQPPQRPARVYQPAPPPPPPPSSEVYAYPLHGQNAQQQDRDHYECSLWATQQTGFDPSAPGVPPHERVRVVSGPPPGTGTAVGAVTGAIIGAAISRPWEAATGALAGAVV